MPDLISFADHEREIAALYARDKKKLTGIACPTCDTELKWTGEFDDTTHKRPVACTKRSCSYTGEAYG